MSGSSQVVIISRGDDRKSVKNRGENPRFSLFCHSKISEIRLIKKL